jgi:hypothetical protein
MLIAHARQFCFGVADGFVTTNNRIDRHLTFGLQLRDPRARITKLARILFSFDFSLGVLACGAIDRLASASIKKSS